MATENTVTVTDSTGHEFEAELGADGVNPVSVNNPPAKAISEKDVEVVKDETAKAEDRLASVGEGSDGPGNEHNAEFGTATPADLRDSTRPDTTRTAAAEAPADEAPADAADEAPAKNASKADWVDYAVNVKDADREYAESKTRDELAEEFGA